MPLPFDKPPDTLCLIRLSAIGDCCHTVPVVRAIQDAWPETRISWIIGRTEFALLEGLNGVEFVILDKTAGLSGYAEVRRQLGGRRFPVLLHMHASARANLVSTLVSAERRLGFDRARAKDYQWLFCNDRVPATPRQHVMDGLFEFSAALGIGTEAPRWDIPLEPADIEFAERQLDATRPSMIISPCTGARFRNFRNWNVKRYAEVADYAHKRYGAQVILTGGSTDLEREYGQGISRLSGAAPKNLIGRSTLKQLLAMIARATLVVCPDSGPAHMATAAGTAVVGLYATSNRFRTGPYFSQDLVVDKYPEAVHRYLGKSVDDIPWGARVRDPDAMNLITVADVTKKIDLAFRQLSRETKASRSGF